MLRGLYLTVVYLAFFVFGASAPFALTLGYLWVDGSDPQYLSYGSGLLPKIPSSLAMGAAAVGSYMMMDRRPAPRFNFLTGAVVVFAVWCTVTTVMAEVPDAAWSKWNVAFKTLLFSAFIPYVIRSRVQIEAFLQVFLFSTAIFFLPVGLKTMVSGGGYGVMLSIVSSNAGLAEGSTLASISLMMIPIMFCLSEHSLLLDFPKLRRLGYLGLCIVAVAAAVGTYERTALVGMAVVGASMWLKSRHKLFFGTFLGVTGAAVMLLTSSAWNDRISTINDYTQEGSAMGRILVWRWTLDYVAHHPLGGGFDVYLINHIVFADGYEVVGKAFHSIYFEVLGEQGVIGIALFGGILVYTLLTLRRVIRQTRGNAEMRWARDFASALQASLLTIMACGSFIGVAFQPFIYYVVAMAVSLSENVRIAELPTAGASVRQRVLGPVVQQRDVTELAGLVTTAPIPGSVPPWRARTQDAGRHAEHG